MPKRVVVVDDDVLITVYLRTLCEQFGCEVVGVSHSASNAEETILREAPDFVFMDLRLGGQRDGVDVAKTVKETLPQTRFVFITGSSESASTERIRSVGPEKILIKPVAVGAIRAALG